jgi:UDP-glucose 4-epimerase
VEDIADAHILALEYLFKGGGTDRFNIGTGDGNSVAEVVALCESVVGRKVPVKIRPRRPGDPATLTADNRKAKRTLGWEPKRSLRQSIETAYAWEKKMAGMRR